MQIQHGEKRVRGEAELLYTREVLAASFDRLVSHLFLVVGCEVHGESFLIAPCLVCGTCACAYLNGKMIASLHSIIDTRQTRPSPLCERVWLRQTRQRQRSGTVHGMLAMVTRPSSPDGLARETKLEVGFTKQKRGPTHQLLSSSMRISQRARGKLRQGFCTSVLFHSF